MRRQHCGTMVRCRLKCSNSFPVPHGHVDKCTGNYEDDTCMGYCDDGYKLEGDSKVYCKGGVWTNDNGNPPQLTVNIWVCISLFPCTSIVGARGPNLLSSLPLHSRLSPLVFLASHFSSLSKRKYSAFPSTLLELPPSVPLPARYSPW